MFTGLGDAIGLLFLLAGMFRFVAARLGTSLLISGVNR